MTIKRPVKIPKVKRQHATAIAIATAVVAVFGAGLLGGATGPRNLLLVSPYSSPPPDALAILWADYCSRVVDARCSTTTASGSVAPSPTPTLGPPTATPTPTATIAPTPTPASTPVPADSFILASKAQLASKPTTGAAYSSLIDWASRTPNVDLSNLNSDGDVITFAKALVFARTGDPAMRSQVIAALIEAKTSPVYRALELARGLGAYVLAADLVGYRDPAFVAWAKAQRTRPVTGGPATLDICAAVRPNNWGTWCRSSRLIVDYYVGDTADIAFSIQMFRGYLGDRAQYANFTYGDLSWQSDPTKPVGINPTGALIAGHNVDGVAPDDQRRAGSFSWPPPCENYVAEALQGTTLEATVLANHGYPSWGYSNSAIKRAIEFKYDNNCPFVGDDNDIPFVADAVYGTNHAGTIPSGPGKGWGFTDWLFGP